MELAAGGTREQIQISVAFQVGECRCRVRAARQPGQRIRRSGLLEEERILGAAGVLEVMEGARSLSDYQIEVAVGIDVAERQARCRACIQTVERVLRSGELYDGGNERSPVFS